MKRHIIYFVILLFAYSAYSQAVKGGSNGTDKPILQSEDRLVTHLNSPADNTSTTESEYFNEAIKKYDAKDYKGAIEYFSKVIELHNLFYAEAYYNRGVVKFKLEDYKGAVADYDESLKVNPNFAEAYFNRGNVKLKTGDKSGACLDFTKAAELGYIKAKNYMKDYCK
ncbi:MAG: tetratricopeptide repeat protein [Bacteroidetes bacterium]|nr:tetratricopeptide repeat protein [Bacteroidota bacterium]